MVARLHWFLHLSFLDCLWRYSRRCNLLYRSFANKQEEEPYSNRKDAASARCYLPTGELDNILNVIISIFLGT